ncbi:MAG: protein-disulfide reductase DsbD family protein [Rhodospirillaceae bacterium]|nr:protein-disulfide reductase DsbD family protein [Rhodospirillaceae bacterium]
MNRFLTTICLIGTFALSSVGPAWTQATVTTERVTATLMTERPAVAPGDTIWVGLKLEIDPGWHTYWRNPGDSGLATMINWSSVPDLEAGPIQWPTPERQPYGTLMNFGYSDEVTLLARLSVADESQTGNVLLSARVTWLVCADICIPEDGSFSIPITIDPAAPQASTMDGAYLNSVALALPEPLPGAVSASMTPEVLTVDGDWGDVPSGEITFFPYATYLMDNTAPQRVTRTATGFRLTVATVPGPDQVETLGGLITVGAGLTQRAFAFENAPMILGAAAPPVAEMAATDMSLVAALLFAFLGGILLNLMPCVLPVLSMKALAVVKYGEGGSARRDALTYTAGVLASFGVLVAVLLVLKASGDRLGWGFQLQSPGFVTILAYIMLAVGLSLSGVFNIGNALMGFGSTWIKGDGPVGSFLTGVLAAVVATPCTAPLMAPAIGYALTQPPLVVIAVFEGLALGLAAPFLLIGFMPAAARALPKPGAWMETFKQVLAFPMYGAVAWLIWVVAQQVDPMGLAATLAGIILVAFTAWMIGSSGDDRPVIGTGLAFAAALGAIVLAGIPQAPNAQSAQAGNAASNSEPYSPARLDELRARGTPVFINFTAAWCITCLVNEKAVLSNADVQAALESKGVVYLKADWTNRDPSITAALESFGRSGVPLYVLYDAAGQPQVQPQILTPGAFIEALDTL